MPSRWDPDMLRELIVGGRAGPSAAVAAPRTKLARLSSRDRPGHDLDAGYPVRCRADAGRECAAGIFFFLMIRRPPRSTLFPYTSELQSHSDLVCRLLL